MTVRTSGKRAGLALGAVAAVAIPLAVTTASPASASTIPNGQLQICAQGNYPAFVNMLPVDLGDGSTSRGIMSTIVNPGNCWIANAPDTFGRYAQVDVVGLRPDGSEFYIGSQWFNSSNSGLGLGAEGSPEGPYIWQW